MIQAVVFDFAGVIINKAGWLWLAETFPDLEEKRDFLRDVSNKADRGDMTTQEFVQIIAEVTHTPAKEVWPEIRKRVVVNRDLLAFIDELKKTYRTGLLSNYVYDWANEIMTDFDLYKYFDHVVISSQVRMIKPDPRIFMKTLALMETAPEETIFVDDLQKNIDAACELGIKGILYTSVHQLKTDMVPLLQRTRRGSTDQKQDQSH